MTQFALKSIHPVNLLSFGPETEPIEIRPLNILIGANGSGKSNLIEAVRLLHFLPDKDTWGIVRRTGGVGEWVWKGPQGQALESFLGATFSVSEDDEEGKKVPVGELEFRATLHQSVSFFRVDHESLAFLANPGKNPFAEDNIERASFERTASQGVVRPSAPNRERFAADRALVTDDAIAGEIPGKFSLAPDRSIFSQVALHTVQGSTLIREMPQVVDTAEFLDSFDFHQDWRFGADSPVRQPQPVGQSIARLEQDNRNLAQILAHFRDHEEPIFSKLDELFARFYEPARRIRIKLISTYLEIAIEEEGGYSTPASRLSDGMLRWLAILCILLNPSPPPVTCIDEPELGLHPDILPTLADLLRDASTRTQLIVTTHSASLIDAFSRPEDAESVCVTEKVEGSTVIRRLKADELAVWLEEYSLGSLWTSGQIGGNRW